MVDAVQLRALVGVEVASGETPDVYAMLGEDGASGENESRLTATLSQALAELATRLPEAVWLRDAVDDLEREGGDLVREIDERGSSGTRGNYQEGAGDGAGEKRREEGEAAGEVVGEAAGEVAGEEGEEEGGEEEEGDEGDVGDEGDEGDEDDEKGETGPKLLLIMRGLPGSGKSSVVRTITSACRHAAKSPHEAASAATVCSADFFFERGAGKSRKQLRELCPAGASVAQIYRACFDVSLLQVWTVELSSEPSASPLTRSTLSLGY